LRAPGNHVTAIYYTATLANAGTPVKIFDRDGLTLTATCDPGNGPLVTAHTGKNNSSLMATSNDGLSSQQGLFNLLTTSDQLVMDYNGAGNGGKAVASQNAQVHINYSQPVTGSGVLKTGAGITEISVQSLLLPYGGGSVRCAVTGEAVSRAAVLVAG
jgi:hypothetical protein